MLQGIYQLTSIGLAITKRTRYYPVATGIAAVASVTANVLLIPHFGVLGAAWANMISYGVLAAVATWFSQRFYPISYEWGRLARIVVGGGTAYLAPVTLVPSLLPPIWGLLIRGSLVVAIYPTILYVTGFFRPTELRRLQSMRARVVPPPVVSDTTLQLEIERTDRETRIP